MKLLAARIALALLPALVRGQTCDPSATASAPSEISSNGCLYGACQGSGDMASWSCVYSSAECSEETEFLDANVASAMGKICTCFDILNFPSLIGSCRHEGGIDSPMATAGDCSNGTPVCPSDENSGMYVIGDVDSAMEFTACDLACHHGNGHAGQVPTESYQSCELPTVVWATASVGESGGMAGNNVVSAIVNGVSTVIVAGEAYGNSEFRGPFTPDDPDGKASDVTAIEHSVEEPNEGFRPWDATFYMVSAETGAPLQLFSVTNPGEAYVHALGVAGTIEPTLMALGGEFAPTPDNTGMVGTTKVCTPAEYNDQDASVTCLENDDGTFVTTLIPTTKGWPGYIVAANPTSGEIQWMRMAPWLELSEQELVDGRTLSEHSVLGIQISDNGADMYLTGFKKLNLTPGTQSKFTGVVCRLNGSDGSTVWCKEFPELKFAIKSALDDDALYFTAEMDSTSTKGALGVSCDNPSGGCALLIRISTDGEVEWVRMADGYNLRPWEGGEVHLDDGPFVYAAFSDTGIHGPTSLDQGTSYAACLLPDGTLVPEYDSSSIDQTQVLDEQGCAALGATFVARDSQTAIPPYVASTGAHCFGASGTSCLVKYHKSNGLPVWGAEKHKIASFVVHEEGILAIGVLGSTGAFDSVMLGSTRGALDGWGIIFASQLSLDGEGISVQPLVTAPRSYAGGCALTQDSNGDIFSSFYFASDTARFGNHWDLDTGLGNDALCADYDSKCEGMQRLAVAKVDLENLETPSCLESCGVTSSSSCFVDQFCFANGEQATFLGHPCMACEASSNTLVPFEVGTNFCFIDEACYYQGMFKPIPVGRGRFVDSECQFCQPASDSAEWALLEGWTFENGECVPPITTDAPVAVVATNAPVPSPTNAPVPSPTNAPIPSPTDAPESSSSSMESPTGDAPSESSSSSKPSFVWWKKMIVGLPFGIFLL